MGGTLLILHLLPKAITMYQYFFKKGIFKGGTMLPRGAQKNGGPPPYTNALVRPCQSLSQGESKDTGQTYCLLTYKLIGRGGVAKLQMFMLNYRFIKIHGCLTENTSFD